MLSNKILNNNGTLYILFRKIVFTKDGKEIIEGLKLAWMCDTVLKNGNEYMFCRKIDDIECELINKN
jgi:hypothetical protein